jgi:hypothetical protein
MFRLAQAVKSHREFRRNRRALGAAFDSAATPSMRSELIVLGQRIDSIR